MKYLSLLATTVFFITFSAFADTPHAKLTQAQEKLEKLEKIFDGKIGIYAIDTNDNQTIAYHADERFPVKSTMKLIGVAALLKQSQSEKNLLEEKIYYTKSDLFLCIQLQGNMLIPV